MGNDPVKIAANKGFQATAHKLPLCDRFPSLQSYIVLPVGRRLNPDVQQMRSDPQNLNARAKV